MKISFLHLSDLHFRPNWPEESGLVCARLIEDLRVQVKKFSNLYLVFSGDLVHAGAERGFYSEFLNRFDKEFEAMGLPRARRLCVPGNHDISRTALKPSLFIQQSIISAVADEHQFNGNLQQIEKAIARPVFENYIEAEQKFAEFTCCSDGLGGRGWQLAQGVGIFCLNTAICSAGGLEDDAGKSISDKERLHIDTRSLHQWLITTTFNTRILIMHHPLTWLSEWAQAEIENIIADKFHLVFSGHVHKATSIFSTRNIKGTVSCVAPALFTRKSELLGYSVVVLDTESYEISVTYRQWTPSHSFVPGTSLASNETGTKVFSPNSSEHGVTEIRIPAKANGTLEVLRAEFEEAITSESSKKQIWVERELSQIPETAKGRTTVVMTPPKDLIRELRRCVIRAPKQFGLTCLGRFLALEHFLERKDGTALLMLDTSEVPGHRRGLLQAVEARARELGVSLDQISGFILDRWQNEKQSRRVLEELQKEFPNTPTILLHGLDDAAQIATSVECESLSKHETFYLWALSRTKIRELVAAYLKDHTSLDEDLVTSKIIADIDALNIHRTPLNCLMILKLLEQAFDDSPVNRTEMIGRYLWLLFYQFDKIPRYATKPDLKDCEYALGYISEWLIREGRWTFTKNEFFSKVQEYCSLQLIDLDCEVLFAFLSSENILFRRGYTFEFRFTYWLYYFAAHRMHHNAEFAKFILSSQRYSSMPEIIEFYTGIDRRRSDAVQQLISDLKQMDAEFLHRTGITDEFNPFGDAQWAPDAEAVTRMQESVRDSVRESSLPKVVKDAIADHRYDPAKPYRQEIAKFLDDSTLAKMLMTMRGAARALRNSDHVEPNAKTELLNQVLTCWTRVCQILAVLSQFLAEHKAAVFEGIRFYLDDGFDSAPTPKDRWKMIMSVVLDNVADMYQEDIFSRKMGALVANHVSEHKGSLTEALLMLVVVRQRPPGWDREVEKFIVRNSKNSFYLSRVFQILIAELKTSFASEGSLQHLRHLSAMALAKHATGSKHPNLRLVEKVLKDIDRAVPKPAVLENGENK